MDEGLPSKPPGPGCSSFIVVCFMGAPKAGPLKKEGLRGKPAQAAAGPAKGTARARAPGKRRAGGPLPTSLPSRLLHVASDNAAFIRRGPNVPRLRLSGGHKSRNLCQLGRPKESFEAFPAPGFGRAQSRRLALHHSGPGQGQRFLPSKSPALVARHPLGESRHAHFGAVRRHGTEGRFFDCASRKQSPGGETTGAEGI